MIKVEAIEVNGAPVPPADWEQTDGLGSWRFRPGREPTLGDRDTLTTRLVITNDAPGDADGASI